MSEEQIHELTVKRRKANEKVMALKKQGVRGEKLQQALSEYEQACQELDKARDQS